MILHEWYMSVKTYDMSTNKNLCSTRDIMVIVFRIEISDEFYRTVWSDFRQSSRAYRKLETALSKCRQGFMQYKVLMLKIYYVNYDQITFFEKSTCELRSNKCFGNNHYTKYDKNNKIHPTNSDGLHNNIYAMPTVHCNIIYTIQPQFKSTHSVIIVFINNEV